jgi:hypothetical protein
MNKQAGPQTEVYVDKQHTQTDTHTPLTFQQHHTLAKKFQKMHQGHIDIDIMEYSHLQNHNNDE